MDPQEICAFPAYNGEVVLGVREDLPETDGSELAAEQLSGLCSALNTKPWLLNDIGEKVQVAASDQQLTVSLTPFF